MEKHAIPFGSLDERHAFPDEKETRTHSSTLRTNSSERKVMSRAPFRVNVRISGTTPKVGEKRTRTSRRAFPVIRDKIRPPDLFDIGPLPREAGKTATNEKHHEAARLERVQRDC